ncbi:MAG TPA: hypothetical protein VFW62_01755 [bacterium]|nr:hypothetical protein [bacterium]
MTKYLTSKSRAQVAPMHYVTDVHGTILAEVGRDKEAPQRAILFAAAPMLKTACETLHDALSEILEDPDCELAGWRGKALAAIQDSFEALEQAQVKPVLPDSKVERLIKEVPSFSTFADAPNLLIIFRSRPTLANPVFEIQVALDMGDRLETMAWVWVDAYEGAILRQFPEEVKSGSLLTSR